MPRTFRVKEFPIPTITPTLVCYPDGEEWTCNAGGIGPSEYIYDGDGQRVRRIIAGVSGSEETWQVYGLGGELLAEYAPNAAPATIKKEYGYRNGVLLVTGQKNAGNANLEWLVTDQLGTPRMVIDKTGSLAGVSRHDYLPFGEEIFAGTGARTTTQGYDVADGVRQKFTSKERDNETGLDYFLARYYSSTQGRFTGVDPENAGANPSDPQSWNGYAYARNNPLLYSDPDGRTYTVCDADGKSCVNYTDKDFDRFLKGAGKDGYTVNNGYIYYNGELTAKYSNDCLSCQSLINEMAARGPAIKKLTGAFAGTAVVIGTGAGVALYSIGTFSVTVTTLGLETSTATTATVSEGGLASFSIQQLNAIIRGTQKQLLNRLFGQGMEGAQQGIASGGVPAGITRQTLMVAKEIAQRAIARGIDKGGVQAVRLKIIEEALKKIK